MNIGSKLILLGGPLVAICASVLHAQGAVQTIGNPCGGTGPGASIGITQPLSLGGTSIVRFTNLPNNALGVFVVGASGAPGSWNGAQLPISLAQFGMSPCQLQVSAEAWGSFAAPGGTGQFIATLPNLPAFVGTNLYTQAMFQQPGFNPAGIGATPGLRMRIGGGAAPTTMVSSITQWGITYQFAQPVPAGRFANGDWFVVGNAPIVDMLPRVTTLNGRTLHGAMIDPNPAVRDQGYDSGLYGQYAPGTYHTNLNRALNVSAASPLVLQPGHSLIKVISNTDTSLVPQIRTASVLTSVAAAPPLDSFRPPYAGPDHQVRYDVSMIDWSQLRNLPAASGMPYVPDEIRKFDRVWLDSPGWVSRLIHPVENMPDYGRDLSSLYAQGALLANTAISAADRRALVIRLVQIGIDNWGNFSNGCRWEGNGGHGSGRKLPILFAGALLRDSGMLGVGQFRSVRNNDGSRSSYFGEDCQTFVVAQTSPGVINFGYGGYTSSQIGLADFGFAHVDQPSSDDATWTGNSYRTCCTANAWLGSVLVARAMGLVDEWNHPPLFTYTDRYVTVERGGWTMSWLPWVENMWKAHRASF